MECARSLNLLSLLLGVTLVSACSRDVPQVAEWADPSPHAERYIMANGVRLHVLDWGGTGDPLILIPGSGDNPHVFDAIAPQFTDRFRVVSYARRENGRSERRGPYEVETLVEDLRQLLDTLQFSRVNFAGWSLAGHEMTRFAGLYPDRVGKLVYLDAAYDWSIPERLEIAASMPQLTGWNPSPDDLQSFDSYLRWFSDVSVWRGPAMSPAVEAYARGLVSEQPEGKLQIEPSDATVARWRTELSSYRRDYSAVQASVLAIYAATWAPMDEPDAAVRAALEKWTGEEWLPWQRSEREKFERGVRNSRVHMLAQGTHMTFLFTEESEIVGLMRQFLLD